MKKSFLIIIVIILLVTSLIAGAFVYLVDYTEKRDARLYETNKAATEARIEKEALRYNEIEDDFLMPSEHEIKLTEFSEMEKAVEASFEQSKQASIESIEQQILEAKEKLWASDILYQLFIAKD